MAKKKPVAAVSRVLMRGVPICAGKPIQSTIPVSYTHLDVYKRQLTHLRATGNVLNFVIPTGNLGNALACLLAKRMGCLLYTSRCV